MADIEFSIVTVCYNAEKYIAETIRSLAVQKYKNYEYFIIEGNSTDKTLDCIEQAIKENVEFDLKKVHIISEPDKGIYDAMNKAVGLAKGKYMYFLNAGDCLDDELVLQNVAFEAEEKKADILYGNIQQIYSDGTKVIRLYDDRCVNKIYFLTGDVLCHQAMFSKRELYNTKMFDITYKVCADKEWLLFQICKKKIVFAHVDDIISCVQMEGYSSMNVKTFDKETKQCVHKYLMWMAIIYDVICVMKNNQYFLSLFRIIEKKKFRKSVSDER